MFLGRELTSGLLRRLDRGRMIAVTESVLKGSPEGTMKRSLSAS